MESRSKSLREEMIKMFGSMMKPARMILRISAEEFSRLSGIPEDVIEEAESGESFLTYTEYLAAASVFDNVCSSEEKNIYDAVVRLLAPGHAFYDEDETDNFILVRRWLGTFEADDEADDEHETSQISRDTGILDDYELERITVEYRIFADASSIEDENFHMLMKTLEPFLTKHNAALIIPNSAMNDLNDDYVASEDEDEDEESLKASIDLIERYVHDGVITIRGNDSGTNSYEELSDIFSRLQDEYRFSLITQDIETAKTIYDDNEDRRIPVLILRFNEDGKLMNWEFDD